MPLYFKAEYPQEALSVCKSLLNEGYQASSGVSPFRITVKKACFVAAAIGVLGLRLSSSIGI